MPGRRRRRQRDRHLQLVCSPQSSEARQNKKERRRRRGRRRKEHKSARFLQNLYGFCKDTAGLVRLFLSLAFKHVLRPDKYRWPLKAQNKSGVFTECNLQRHLTAQHSLSPIIPRHVTDFPLALVFVVVSDVREACLVRALECAGATFGMYTALTGVKLPGQATAVAEGNALGKGVPLVSICPTSHPGHGLRSACNAPHHCECDMNGNACARLLIIVNLHHPTFYFCVLRLYKLNMG